MASAFGQIRHYGTVSIEIFESEISSALNTHGYGVTRLMLYNQTDQEQEVQLLLDNGNYDWVLLNRMSRNVLLTPNATVEVILPVDGSYMLPHTIDVLINGEKQEEGVPVQFGNRYSTRSLRAAVLLDQANDFSAYFTSIYSSAPKEWLDRIEIPVASEPLITNIKRASDWTPFWLDYSGYEQVWLTHSAWVDLAKPVKEALKQWVRNGGHLVLHSNADNTLDEFHGSLVDTGTDVRTKAVAFGLVSACNAYAALEPPEKNYFVQDLAGAILPWLIGPESARYALDLEIDEDVPIRGFIVLIMIFAVVLGPISLFVLYRRNKRMWLYITVPSLSLFATLCIFAFSFFYYGTQSRVKRYALVYLDQAAHRANVIGYDAIFPMVGISSGLHFPLNAEVQPNISSGTNQWRHINFDNGQSFRQGWLPARTLSQFRYRFEETRRERVLFSKDGQTLKATNFLGAELEWLVYKDEVGDLYTANKLPVGKAVVLTRLAHDDGMQRRQIYNQGWFDFNFKETIEDARKRGLSQNNTYLAVMKADPFNPATIEDLSSLDTITYVIGEGGQP